VLANELCRDEEGKKEIEITCTKKIEAEYLDVFPLGAKSSEKKLNNLAEFFSEQIKKNGIEPFSWIFDVSCSNLPKVKKSQHRRPQRDITFDTWMYEHSSNWVLPFLGKR
jgi:hypothetical protein